MAIDQFQSKEAKMATPLIILLLVFLVLFAYSVANKKGPRELLGLYPKYSRKMLAIRRWSLNGVAITLIAGCLYLLVDKAWVYAIPLLVYLSYFLYLGLNTRTMDRMAQSGYSADLLGIGLIRYILVKTDQEKRLEIILVLIISAVSLVFLAVLLTPIPTGATESEIAQARLVGRLIIGFAIQALTLFNLWFAFDQAK